MPPSAPLPGWLHEACLIQISCQPESNPQEDPQLLVEIENFLFQPHLPCRSERHPGWHLSTPPSPPRDRNDQDSSSLRSFAAAQQNDAVHPRLARFDPGSSPPRRGIWCGGHGLCCTPRARRAPSTLPRNHRARIGRPRPGCAARHPVGRHPVPVPAGQRLLVSDRVRSPVCRGRPAYRRRPRLHALRGTA